MTLKFEKLSITKFVLMLFAVFALLIFSAAAFAFNDTTGYAIYYIQILFYVLMFIAFYYLGLTKMERRIMMDGGEEKKSLHLAFLPFLVGGLVTIIYVLILQNFLPGLYESYMEASELMEGISFQTNKMELILLFISVVILAPIVEEIVFRGIFFNLLNRKRSTLFAMVVSSLIFGLLHAQTMVPTAVIGFVLCFIYHRTGSLLLVMAGHMVNNLIAFSLPLIIGDNDMLGSGYEILGLVLVALYIIFTIYFVYYYMKNRHFLKFDAPMYRAAEGGRADQNVSLDEKTGYVPAYTAPSPVRIIDISKALFNDMPVYEGDPEVKIRKVRSVPDDGYSVHSISLNTHAGTHLDFPSHFIDEGKNLNDMDLGLFYGEVIVTDSFEDLLPRGTRRVIAKAGYLTHERAEALIAGGIRLVGTVNDSIEQDSPYKVHKTLLENDIIIMENLNADTVEKGRYTLSAFPLKIDGAEAAPARVVLIDDLRGSSQDEF